MASAWLDQFDHKDVRPFPHNLPFPRRRAYRMIMRVLTTAGIRTVSERTLNAISSFHSMRRPPIAVERTSWDEFRYCEQ
jgi:hypothetical protein